MTVYLAQPTGGGAIRIGCSEDPNLRAKQLGSWILGGVEVVATIPGGFMREAVLLHAFAPIRIEKDWYRSCPTMWRYLLDVLAGRGEWWLPAIDQRLKPTDQDVLERFGDYDSATSALGYAVPANLREAVNSSSTRSCSAAARIWVWDAINTGRAPDYILEAHRRPSIEVAA